MSSLPTPLRAALGLALTVVDTARDTATHLPQKAAGLPIAVASQAVQLSLRAQQQYAAYVNKGDELIGAFRGAPEEAPAWATFDDDAEPAGPTPARNTAFDRVPDADLDVSDTAFDGSDLGGTDLTDTDALDELADLAAVVEDDAAMADESRLDVALDLLDGSYEGLDAGDGTAPRVTPGAPDTAADGVRADADGDEVVGAEAPRTTASREPAPRKAARKTPAKSSRKTAPRPSAAATTGGLPSPGRAAAKKAARTAAARKAAAKKAGSRDVPAGAPPAPETAAAPAAKAARKAAAKTPAKTPAKSAARKATRPAAARKAPRKAAPTTLEGAPLQDATVPVGPDPVDAARTVTDVAPDVPVAEATPLGPDVTAETPDTPASSGSAG